jgi:hypothetical protein
MRYLGHKPPPLKVFTPQSRGETAEGWVLHATRRRRIHEEEARTLDRRRYIWGTLDAALAAVAGTSAFAAWKTSNNTLIAVGAAILGILAAVLASALTFLDMGGRAETHQHAAIAYKEILREFEEAFGNGSQSIDSKTLSNLKSRLSKVDRTAPTVPVNRGSKIEQRDYCFVTKAQDLAAGACPRPVKAGVTRADEEPKGLDREWRSDREMP